jgi:hypothetical protein
VLLPSQTAIRVCAKRAEYWAAFRFIASFFKDIFDLKSL